MKEQILDFRPNSIFDVIDEDFFFEKNDPLHKDYINSKNYYEVYYSIGAYFQPKSILEIGVRYGYSLYSLIKGSDSVEYVVGYDIDQYEKGSVQRAKEEIDKRISGINFNVFIQDSQQLDKIEFFDLIHIDGDHSYEGKLHDLNLTLGSSKVVVIDDYNHIKEVKYATDMFVEANKEKIKETILINSFRGTYIIIYA